MNSNWKIAPLNTLLILISLVLAFCLPFRLFLFSYAVLGPLHYLTEIKWLNERSFFSHHGKNWKWAFVVLAALMLLYPAIRFVLINHFTFFRNLIPISITLSHAAILVALQLAILMMLISNKKTLTIAFALVCIGSFLVVLLWKSEIRLITLLLPTVVHVFLFTLLFMIYGVKRSSQKSNFDRLNIALMVIIPLFIFWFPDVHSNFIVSDQTLESYKDSNLTTVVNYFTVLLGDSNSNSPLAPLSMKVKVFLAFAYTYHYLNWFSKTSVIGWLKNSSKPQITAVLIIWFASMGLYYYNYQLGFLALFFLSFLHVFMEFPLNVLTFKELLQKRST